MSGCASLGAFGNNGRLTGVDCEVYLWRCGETNESLRGTKELESTSCHNLSVGIIIKLCSIDLLRSVKSISDGASKYGKLAIVAEKSCV
jgi:hypothetical protein